MATSRRPRKLSKEISRVSDLVEHEQTEREAKHSGKAANRQIGTREASGREVDGQAHECAHHHHPADGAHAKDNNIKNADERRRDSSEY